MKFVKSTYGRRWTGVVLEDKIERSDGKRCLTRALIVKNAYGGRPKRRVLVCRHEDWFEDTEPFDISYINKDWFKL